MDWRIQWDIYFGWVAFKLTPPFYAMQLRTGKIFPVVVEGKYRGQN